MAVQNRVACLISQHPHNGHVAPLLVLYLRWQWGQALPPYQCARAALRLQSEQCSYNAASQCRKLRNFNSFPWAPFLVGCSCRIAWPVLFCPISCRLLCVSPSCQSSPAALCSLFLQLSASYSILFFQSFQRFFQSMFKDAVMAFQVPVLFKSWMRWHISLQNSRFKVESEFKYCLYWGVGSSTLSSI